MNEVINYVRDQGHLVLLDENDRYRVNDCVMTARQLLTFANSIRMRAGLPLFPLDLANPTHVRRNRQKGSLHLLVASN